MDKDQIIKIIEVLEHVRKTPQMYFGTADDVGAVRGFLHGFNIAYMLITGKEAPRFDPDGWEASYYKVPFPHPNRNIDEIEAKDLVDQTLDVQINAWKKLFEAAN